MKSFFLHLPNSSPSKLPFKQFFLLISNLSSQNTIVFDNFPNSSLSPNPCQNLPPIPQNSATTSENDTFSHHTPVNARPITPSIPTQDNTTYIIVRRSERAHQAPNYLKDYVCAGATQEIHWCNLVQFHNTDKTIKSHVVYEEPTSYHQALQDSRWVVAMKKELEALEKNNT